MTENNRRYTRIEEVRAVVSKWLKLMDDRLRRLDIALLLRVSEMIIFHWERGGGMYPNK